MWGSCWEEYAVVAVDAEGRMLFSCGVQDGVVPDEVAGLLLVSAEESKQLLFCCSGGFDIVVHVDRQHTRSTLMSPTRIASTKMMATSGSQIMTVVTLGVSGSGKLT
jgi:hypothetical protein